MSQIAVASTHSRIGNRHSSVIYFEEQDVEPVTDEEILELCQLAQEQTIDMPNAELIDLIDGMNPNDSWRVFM